MSKSLPPKDRSYLVENFLETIKEIEPKEYIMDSIAGFALAIIAVHYGIAGRAEAKELIFLGIGSGLVPLVFMFLLRFIFLTPAKIRRTLKQKLQTAELIKGVPFTAKASDPKIIIPGTQYALELSIFNPNQATSGIELRLKDIKPPIKGHAALTTAMCDLGQIDFAFNDVIGDILKNNQSGHYTIFRTEKNVNEARPARVIIGGKWKSQLNNEFCPESGESYLFIMELYCVGPPGIAIECKITFKNGEGAPFSVESCVTKTLDSAL
jgi:hypothetical protein